MMCDFAISCHCNKHTTNTPLKRQASCFHQTVTIATAAALRELYNNHFSGTIPASLASSTSLQTLYVPYPGQMDNRPIDKNVQIMVQTQGCIIEVGGCRVEGSFNDSTKDEDLMCMIRIQS